jgi:hypothetical protein
MIGFPYWDVMRGWIETTPKRGSKRVHPKPKEEGVEETASR